MSVRLTEVHMSEGGYLNEHIVSVRWVEYGTGKTDTSTKPQMIEWLDKGGSAYVESATTKVAVLVVRPQHGEPYLRTYANGTWTDNDVDPVVVDGSGRCGL